MLPCVDGEAAHHIKPRIIILSIMFFNPLGYPKGFFLAATEFLARNVPISPQQRSRKADAVELN